MAHSSQPNIIREKMKSLRLEPPDNSEDDREAAAGEGYRVDKDSQLGFPEKYLTKGKYWFPGKDNLSEDQWNVLVYGESALKDSQNLEEKLGDEYDKYCFHLGQPFLPELDMNAEERKKYNDSFEWPKEMPDEKPDPAAALKPLALMKHAYGLDGDPEAGDRMYERFHLRSDYTREEKEKRRKVQQERHEMYKIWAEEVLKLDPKPLDPTVPSTEEVQFFKEVHGLNWGRDDLVTDKMENDKSL